MSGFETKLEKLSTSNYSTWELVMTSLMKSKGLWQHVTNQIDVKETPDEEKQKNEEAKILMYSSMEPGQIVATGSCETAYDLWQKIKENHYGAETDLRNNCGEVECGEVLKMAGCLAQRIKCGAHFTPKTLTLLPQGLLS